MHDHIVIFILTGISCCFKKCLINLTIYHFPLKKGKTVWEACVNRNTQNFLFLTETFELYFLRHLHSPQNKIYIN